MIYFFRGDAKLTEVSVSDKLEEFRAAKEVKKIYNNYNYNLLNN